MTVKQGYLFDGFPRTIPQAEALVQQNIQIDSVIEIKVEDKQIISRLAGRRVHHLPSGIYHITNNPPKRKNRDDLTGELLIQEMMTRRDNKAAVRGLPQSDRTSGQFLSKKT